MKKKLLFTLTILFVVFLSSALMAQGQIFTEKEANEKFGTVINKPVNVKKYLAQKYTERYDKILYNVVGVRVCIATTDRAVVYNNLTFGEQLSTDYQMYEISTTVLKELLNKGDYGDNIYFEIRSGLNSINENIRTISYGPYVLELSNPCPPDC